MRAKLGQHFLADPPVLAFEAESANPAGKSVLEIGAGDGRLTQKLLSAGAGHITAVELDPLLAGAWYNLAAVKGGQGRHEEALFAVEKALQINPDDALAWNNKGGTLFQLGRTEEALSCFEKAITLSPGYASAWMNKGSALMKLRRKREAKAAIRKAPCGTEDRPAPCIADTSIRSTSLLSSPAIGELPASR